MILLGPGDNHPLISAVKRRLGMSPGDDYFTDELAARIRGEQMRLRMQPSGLIDDDLMRLLMPHGVQVDA
jgi:hypothetical protein